MANADGPQFKIGHRTYPMPQKFSLGELRILKREFDLKDVAKIDKRDPDHIAGLLYIAMRRKDPTLTVDELDALDIERIEVVGVEEDAEPANPPVAEPQAGPPTS